MRSPVNHLVISKPFSKSHNGDDMGYEEINQKNQPIYACDEGTIIYNRYKLIGGYIIKIKHPNGFESIYGHLLKDSQKIKEGQKVKKGQQIANMGNSGVNCKGNHLHFSLKNKKGKYVNPLNYINVYKDQTVGSGTEKRYKILHTKIAKNIPDEPLLVHNEPNYNKASVVKNVGIYNNDEVESYGIVNTMNCLDNIRGYYCSDKYLK